LQAGKCDEVASVVDHFRSECQQSLPRNETSVFLGRGTCGWGEPGIQDTTTPTFQHAKAETPPLDFRPLD